MKGRIRTIKPQLGKHYLLFTLGELSEMPKLAYWYSLLWCWADRRGRFEWNPQRLKIEIAPYDKVDFNHALNALANGGFVVQYRVGARLYGWIARFNVHQHINGREEDSVFPAPPDGAAAFSEQAQMLAEHNQLSTKEEIIKAPVCLGSEGAPPHVEPQRPVWVYYIRDGKRVKIGASREPEQRLAQIKTHRPGAELLAIESGGKKRELERQEQFRAHRINKDGSAGREWFRWCEEIASHIALLSNDNELGTRQSHVQAHVPDMASLPTHSLPVHSIPQQREGGETRLPAVRGKKDVAAIRDRMATVFAEVSQQSEARMSADDMRKLQAEMIFLYWAARFKHQGALLDRKREGKIIERLKENSGDVSELLYALDGAAHDPWIIGTDPKSNGKKYDDIPTIFRDRSQIERFAETRRGYKAKEPHKLLAQLEQAARGNGEVHPGE